MTLFQDYNDTVKNPYKNGELPVCNYTSLDFRLFYSHLFVQKGNWMCSMSSQVAKKNTEVNKDIIDKLQAMADLYSKTNGTENRHIPMFVLFFC